MNNQAAQPRFQRVEDNKFHFRVPYTARPAPNTFGTGTPIRQRTAALKCRCDYFQVLSRRLAFAGFGQNILDEPSSTRRAACVKRCGFIRLNTLQGRSQGILVLGGCVHRQRAETDNGHSNQHCCE
jgi:hypothetical protein